MAPASSDVPPAAAAPDQPAASAEPAAASGEEAAPAIATASPALDRDPLQPLNRRMFAIDRRMTRVMDAPLEHLDARPKSRPVVAMARNAFTNLDEPATVLNDILQRKPKRALRAAARFAINSTVGIVGLFDVADRLGLKRAKQDFGRTLGSYGVKPGPFVYLPLIGPTNPRDFVGGMVDAVVSPTRWFKLPVWEHQARTLVVRQLRRSELSREEIRLRAAAPIRPPDDYTEMRRAAVDRRARQVAEARSDRGSVRPPSSQLAEASPP